MASRETCKCGPLWHLEPVSYLTAVVVDSVVMVATEGKGFCLHAVRSLQTYLTVLKWDKSNRMHWVVCVWSWFLVFPKCCPTLVTVFVWALQDFVRVSELVIARWPNLYKHNVLVFTLFGGFIVYKTSFCMRKIAKASLTESSAPDKRIWSIKCGGPLIGSYTIFYFSVFLYFPSWTTFSVLKTAPLLLSSSKENLNNHFNPRSISLPLKWLAKILKWLILPLVSKFSQDLFPLSLLSARIIDMRHFSGKTISLCDSCQT